MKRTLPNYCILSNKLGELLKLKSQFVFTPLWLIRSTTHPCYHVLILQYAYYQVIMKLLLSSLLIFQHLLSKYNTFFIVDDTERELMVKIFLFTRWIWPWCFDRSSNWNKSNGVRTIDAFSLVLVPLYHTFTCSFVLLPLKSSSDYPTFLFNTLI